MLKHVILATSIGFAAFASSQSSFVSVARPLAIWRHAVADGLVTGRSVTAIQHAGHDEAAPANDG